MRVVDLLSPFADSADRVLCVGSGVRGHLERPGGPPVVPAAISELPSADPGALIVVRVAGFASPDIGAALEAAPAACTVVLLVEEVLDAESFSRADAAINADRRVETVAALSYPDLRTGLVLLPAQPSELLRAANVAAWQLAVAAQEKAALEDKVAAAELARRRAEDRRVDAEAAAAHAKTRAAQAEQRVTAMERSASFRVGRSLVGAARNPLRGLVDVPRELAALARKRQSPARGADHPDAGAAAPDATGVAAEPNAAAQARAGGRSSSAAARLLRREIPVDPRPAILGVLSAATAHTLADAARLSLVPPHGAAGTRTEAADLVLIEAAALLPGELWAGAGRPGEVARTRELRGFVRRVKADGVPVVFWRNTGAQELAGVAMFADMATHVVSDDGIGTFWHPGVRIDAGLSAGMPSEPAGGSPSAVALEAIPDDTPRAAVVHGGGTGGAPRQVLEALVQGSRVVWCGGELEPDLAACVIVTDEKGRDAAVREALAAGPPTGAEMRRVRRLLFTRYTPEVQAAALARHVGMAVAEPYAVSVLARLGTAELAPALAHALLAQSVRPTEVVLSMPDGHDETWSELSALGIHVAEVSHAGGWGDLARIARSPWAVPLDLADGMPSWGTDALVDVLAAQAASRAPVVLDAAGGAPVVLAGRELLQTCADWTVPLEDWSAGGMHVRRMPPPAREAA